MSKNSSYSPQLERMRGNDVQQLHCERHARRANSPLRHRPDDRLQGYNSRFDLSMLFGTTEESPAVQVFAVFSDLFGAPTAAEAEAPVSTRNR